MKKYVNRVQCHKVFILISDSKCSVKDWNKTRVDTNYNESLIYSKQMASAYLDALFKLHIVLQQNSMHTALILKTCRIARHLIFAKFDQIESHYYPRHRPHVRVCNQPKDNNHT